MMFKVAKERCGECLFSPNTIVSPDTVRRVIAECQAKDTHFICHKFGIGGDDGELLGEDVCCRGWWDTQGKGQLMRIAERAPMRRVCSSATRFAKARAV